MGASMLTTTQDMNTMDEFGENDENSKI